MLRCSRVRYGKNYSRDSLRASVLKSKYGIVLSPSTDPREFSQLLRSHCASLQNIHRLLGEAAARFNQAKLGIRFAGECGLSGFSSSQSTEPVAGTLLNLQKRLYALALVDYDVCEKRQEILKAMCEEYGDVVQTLYPILEEGGLANLRDILINIHRYET